MGKYRVLFEHAQALLMHSGRVITNQGEDLAAAGLREEKLYTELKLATEEAKAHKHRADNLQEIVSKYELEEVQPEPGSCKTCEGSAQIVYYITGAKDSGKSDSCKKLGAAELKWSDFESGRVLTETIELLEDSSPCVAVTSCGTDLILEKDLAEYCHEKGKIFARVKL